MSKESNPGCCEGKYLEDFNGLLRKVHCCKKLENVLYVDADVGSFPNRRGNPYGSPGPPRGMTVPNVYENRVGYNPAPSGRLVTQPSYNEQGVQSESNRLDVQMVGSQCDDSSGAESCNGYSPANKEVSCDEGSGDARDQSLQESPHCKERINGDLMKVYQCNFCKAYYIYYESYKEHKKKCLKCSKCALTFPTIFELYKHVTSKVHKERFSFLEVCKWTESQLNLHISRNEVHEEDVKKFELIKLASRAKELFPLATESSDGETLSSGHQVQDTVDASSLPIVPVCSDSVTKSPSSPQGQDNVGASSLPCLSVDHVTSLQEKSESPATTEDVIVSKQNSESKDSDSFTCNKENEETVEENNNRIVCMKEKKDTKCLVGQSDEDKPMAIKSEVKQPSNNTQQNENSAQTTSQKGKSDKKLKENKNTTKKKASSEKIVGSKISKTKTALCKSSQNITEDKKLSHKSHNKTLKKTPNGGEAEVKKVELSGDTSLQIDSRVATSEYHKKEEKDSQGKAPQKEQSTTKKQDRKQSTCKTVKSKNTKKDLLQGTKGSRNSKSGKCGLRTNEGQNKQKVAPKSNICQTLDLTVSSSDDNDCSKDASSSTIQSCSSQGIKNSTKKKSEITNSQTVRPHKRSHSFEESAPKTMKLLLKTVRLTSDFTVICKKFDVMPESCPGCSRKIDYTTGVFNTKTQCVSFWCPTCKWDIVLSADIS